MVFSAPETKQENPTEEVQITPEPYFKGDQILVWTRPLLLFYQKVSILYNNQKNLYSRCNSGA